MYRMHNDTANVISFWATWCKPCNEELPYFVTLYSQLKIGKIKVVLVNLDFPKQVESILVPFF